MRKLATLLTLVLIIGTFGIMASGCTEKEEALPEEDVDYEIALVTDDGITDGSGHSEVAWNSIIEFGGLNGISHKYYKATEPTEQAFIEIIKTAINSGAKIVIIDNSSMEKAAYKMQKEYPEIDFVLTDAEPYDAETGDIMIAENTAAVDFDSAQAGYLAGYAAAKEGYTSLGFIGQSEEREIADFGYGYVKGANRGARETGMYIEMSYRYCDDYSDPEKVKKLAEDMYDNGVQVVFAAGSDIQAPVIAAAEYKEGKVIGSISDQSSKSDAVITSAVYSIDKALKDVLKDYEKGDFPGGEVLAYNAGNDGIGLALRVHGLEQLTQKEYDSICEELAKEGTGLNRDRISSVNDIRAPYITIK